MRVLLRHRSQYLYPRPASLGPHLIRLRPAAHARARIETYSLRVTEPGQIRWQQDPAGNHVARVTWDGARLPELEVTVELAVDIRPVNPFDFTLDPSAEQSPVDYGSLLPDLSAYLAHNDPAFAVGKLGEQFLESLPREGRSVPMVVEINRRVAREVRYVIREEAGLWTPEETLQHGRGSCRDSSALLIAALRSRGLAARFASGYLVQLTDEGMLPDEPKGVTRDVADLHAWVEVFPTWGGVGGPRSHQRPALRRRAHPPRLHRHAVARRAHRGHHRRLRREGAVRDAHRPIGPRGALHRALHRRGLDKSTVIPTT
jgi:transglutaminase-like putative cysteine protease